MQFIYKDFIVMSTTWWVIYFSIKEEIIMVERVAICREKYSAKHYKIQSIKYTYWLAH